MTLPDAAWGAPLVAACAGRRVVIIGDLMLDEFLVGRVTRISPEAPVPVVQHDHDEHRAGGAANVAHNVCALGGRAEIIGLVGADPAGARLRKALAAMGVDDRHLVVDPGRRTTRKLRVVTDRHQQVARIDYETDAEAEGAVEEQLARQVESCMADAGIVVVSDYLKGTVTGTVMARLVAAAGRAGVPVLVDPKIPHIDYYAGATLVTPNHHEAEIATHRRIRTDEEAAEAARVFQQRVRCAEVLITRGEHGMCLFDGRSATHLPAVAREVADVTGAGDTVIAALSLGLAAGATLTAAATLANHAAGVVVGKFGAATVTPAELVEALRAESRQLA